ncbi:hypothetical protein Mp_8g14260 [Marchantia polymorpha subsp. ruderalis]|uniref:Uncharacterized protein n=1 Tax=Marchantia polymorpha TaxID=3197 RepID=A0A2R6WCY6_MARPO|nr:hypothetical protein MARPO_0108s0053 [Marchantia polymorpha]BBN19856.1 hypothetical protein Mp_8g14260 [Marchantia polymorpha subsp. ruderalis]|eukprot:PTQ31708.1 hypothetical protein MARPO_0108s0053 [Marchantia polymorpha]
MFYTSFDETTPQKPATLQAPRQPPSLSLPLPLELSSPTLSLFPSPSTLALSPCCRADGMGMGMGLNRIPAESPSPTGHQISPTAPRAGRQAGRQASPSPNPSPHFVLDSSSSSPPAISEQFTNPDDSKPQAQAPSPSIVTTNPFPRRLSPRLGQL